MKLGLNIVLLKVVVFSLTANVLEEAMLASRLRGTIKFLWCPERGYLRASGNQAVLEDVTVT
jgi:hypothetical protein